MPAITCGMLGEQISLPILFLRIVFFWGGGGATEWKMSKHKNRYFLSDYCGGVKRKKEKN